MFSENSQLGQCVDYFFVAAMLATAWTNRFGNSLATMAVADDGIIDICWPPRSNSPFTEKSW